MHRIDAPGNLANMFTEGDPTVPVEATDVSADWLNAVQEELVHVILTAGIALEKTDNTQLWRAIQKLIPEPEPYENPLLYAGCVLPFLLTGPMADWVEAKGGLITSANVTAPKLVDALQNNPLLSGLLVSEEEWQAIYANDSTWRGNQGGCAKFVLDLAANTIRVPDLRGLYMEGAGFDGLLAGGVHGDMIRNITGSISGGRIGRAGSTLSGSGVFVNAGNATVSDSYYDHSGQAVVNFDASRVVPTGVAHKPRAFGVTYCVYLGGSDA